MGSKRNTGDTQRLSQQERGVKRWRTPRKFSCGHRGVEGTPDMKICSHCKMLQEMENRRKWNRFMVGVINET